MAMDTARRLDTARLRILLTNDDGWDAQGITAVYGALTAAGHDVRLVGPAHNNSGVSGGVHFAGELESRRPTDDPNVHAVTATPGGTVLFGVTEVFAGVLPDLVVSGANEGSNTGFDTNFSGTVGAATVGAGFFGIPSVAISTAVRYGPNAGGGAYAETAQLLVDMIGLGLPVLGRGEFLNINYPLLDADRARPVGIRRAPLDSGSMAKFGYTQRADGVFAITPGPTASAPGEGTDTALLREGHVTVTVLNTDRSATSQGLTAVDALIAGASGLLG